MQQVTPPRRDPAPSRLSYRLNRLWLTPLFRKLLRTGLPAFVLIFTVMWYLGDTDRRDALGLAIADMRSSIEARPEFMVKLMAIDGASDDLAEDIREVVPLDFPISSFDLDLPALHETVAGLDAVAKADVHVRPGGILQISVRERMPAVVWRGRQGLELLDERGNRVAPLEARAARPDLPLIIGDGAETQVVEALQLFEVARPLKHRLLAVVRMGERRWDVVLDRDQRILLPERDPVAALRRVIALDQAEEMLDRDLVAIDMRNSARPTLRMAPDALEELRRIRELETRDSDG
ncbi:cell division protein FtsQ/DivIB [Actibacterium ureilyticum]|uniref:cell division protein FtsQ/DivIB n=1 Tax=Actibacterium ureilyticum TaxID=1590614 RepID=UPI000BAABCBE|nr:cell division protein FtsQ/DivIB [Actibacterium ureilyticum]